MTTREIRDLQHLIRSATLQCQLADSRMTQLDATDRDQVHEQGELRRHITRTRMHLKTAMHRLDRQLARQAGTLSPYDSRRASSRG